MHKQLTWIVVVGISAFAGGLSVDWLRSSSASAQSGSPLPPAPAVTEIQNGAPSEAFEAVVRKVSPCVVAVDAVKPPTAPASGTAATKSKPVEESGSGVLIRFPGLAGTVVITNNHVVGRAEPSKVFVTLSDGRILQPQRIVADPESDISLLRLEYENLPVAELGDSDRVHRGQWVLAFGSPFGLNQTVTHGIISATDRGQISLGSTIRIKEFIQTDAAINPGSSGGPLVDLEGRVIGINTAIAAGPNGSNSGVAFSIPANLVKRIGRQLFERGTVSRGYLGVQLATALDPADALRLGLDRVNGALVEVVHAGTPAAASGLRPGDVVLKLEDVGLRNENHLINLVSALPAGQKVRLGVWRDRKMIDIEVSIGDWNSSKAAATSARQ